MSNTKIGNHLDKKLNSFSFINKINPLCNSEGGLLLSNCEFEERRWSWSKNELCSLCKGQKRVLFKQLLNGRRHSIYNRPDSTLLASLIMRYIPFLPGWSGAEIKCTVHVSLPKMAHEQIGFVIAK